MSQQHRRRGRYDRGFDKGIGRPAYHLVNSGEASWFQLASKHELIGAAAKVEPCSSSDFPSKAVRPSYSVLSNDKIAAVCGRPDHWELALSRYLRQKGHIT